MANHKKTKKILNDNWDDIVKLRESGTSLVDIASTYGISRQTLSARFNKRAITTSVEQPALRILTLDIENAPMLSYTWGLWDQSISANMRVDGNRSYMMSIAMKWLGEDEVHYFETRTEDDSELTAKAIEFLDKADIVVGHNAKKFDVKKINAYAALNGIPPPSPYRVVDTMLIAKRFFTFERNTLDYLSHALCTETKSGHGKFTGFELWSECMKGNEEAWAEMQHYNKQDVVATEELYLKLRPWDKAHPNVSTLANSDKPKCISCGSTQLHEDGYSITNLSKFQRYKCENCGGYSRGRTNLIPREYRDNLLAPIVNG